MNTTTTTQPQSFSFHAPAVASVLLVGDFTDWLKNPVSLRRGPKGIWKTTLALKPGNYRYRFLVDGEWQDDPECALRVANPFGTQDAVRTVGAMAATA